MIALPCWRYLIGKLPGTHACVRVKDEGACGGLRSRADSREFGCRLRFSGAFSRCPPLVLHTQSQSSEILTTEEIVIEQLQRELGEVGKMV